MSVFSVSINPIPLYTPAERATPPTLIYHTGAFLPLCIFVRVSKFSTVNIVFIITQSNKGDKKKLKKKKLYPTVWVSHERGNSFSEIPRHSLVARRHIKTEGDICHRVESRREFIHRGVPVLNEGLNFSPSYGEGSHGADNDFIALTVLLLSKQ